MLSYEELRRINAERKKDYEAFKAKHEKKKWKSLCTLHLREYDENGPNRYRTGDRRHNNWPSYFLIGSELWPKQLKYWSSLKYIYKFVE